MNRFVRITLYLSYSLWNMKETACLKWNIFIAMPLTAHTAYVIVRRKCL